MSRTCNRSDAPGGRWIVTRLTVRRCAQRIVSAGCGAAGLAIQGVLGSQSKADLARSAGSEVYTDDAVTSAWPLNRAYLWTSDGATSTADPRSWAWPAGVSVNDASQPSRCHPAGG